jgi:hypothetical protein
MVWIHSPKFVVLETWSPMQQCWAVEFSKSDLFHEGSNPLSVFNVIIARGGLWSWEWVLRKVSLSTSCSPLLLFFHCGVTKQILAKFWHHTLKIPRLYNHEPNKLWLITNCSVCCTVIAAENRLRNTNITMSLL